MLYVLMDLYGNTCQNYTYKVLFDVNHHYVVTSSVSHRKFAKLLHKGLVTMDAIQWNR